mgnify:CR=1 FL=1
MHMLFTAEKFGRNNDFDENLNSCSFDYHYIFKVY